MNAPLRELVVGGLHVQGTIHHDPESAPRSGILRLDADRIATTIHGLPLGQNELSMSMHLSRMEDASLRFEGTRLAQVTFALTDMALDAVAFGTAHPSSSKLG